MDGASSVESFPENEDVVIELFYTGVFSTKWTFSL